MRVIPRAKILNPKESETHMNTGKITMFIFGSVFGVVISAILIKKHERNPDDDVVTIGDTAFPVRVLVDHGVSHRFIVYDHNLVILPPLPQKVEKP